MRSFVVSRSSWPPRAPLRRRPRHSGRTMDPASGCRLWRPPVVACRIRTRARKQRGHEWHSRGGFALDALRCVGDGPYRCQMAFGDVEVPLAPSSDQYTHPHYLPHHHHPHHTTHTVCARDDPFARARRSLAATSRSCRSSQHSTEQTPRLQNSQIMLHLFCGGAVKCTRSCSVQAATPLPPARSGSTVRTSSAPKSMSAHKLLQRSGEAAAHAC